MTTTETTMPRSKREQEREEALRKLESSLVDTTELLEEARHALRLAVLFAEANAGPLAERVVSAYEAVVAACTLRDELVAGRVEAL